MYGVPMRILTWYRETVGGDSTNRVAIRSGVTQSTLDRQLKAGRLSTDVTIAVAHAYEASAIEPLIISGALTALDVRAYGITAVLQEATDREIATEVWHRLVSGAPHPIFSEKPEDAVGSRLAVDGWNLVITLIAAVRQAYGTVAVTKASGSSTTAGWDQNADLITVQLGGDPWEAAVRIAEAICARERAVKPGITPEAYAAARVCAGVSDHAAVAAQLDVTPEAIEMWCLAHPECAISAAEM